MPTNQDRTSLAGAVGAISASHQDFSGDVLRLDAGGSKAAAAGAVLLRASAAGQDVFEVKVREGHPLQICHCYCLLFVIIVYLLLLFLA